MKTTQYLNISKYLPILLVAAIVVTATLLVMSKQGTKMKKIEVPHDTTKTAKAIEIDTLETDPQSGLYLVNITHNDASGNFWMSYGVMKHHGKNTEVVYEFPDPGADKVYVNSGDYILCLNNKNKEILKKYHKPDILSSAKTAFASAQLPADMSCRQSEQEE